MMKIAVIGAGINGLATAVRLREIFKDIEVVVISNEFSPKTTGDGSGGLWFPYLCGNTSDRSLTKWGIETYKLLHKLWLKGGHNIVLIPIYYFYRQETEPKRPLWANEVFGYRILDKKQLKHFCKEFNSDFTSGITFTTFVVHPPSILEYLRETFIQLNGKILEAEVNSMNDSLLQEFDVVINCSGLGSRKLVPDRAVFPIRGQISKVLAPWVSTVVIDEDKCYYIIPNAETCVLGGTHQEENYSREVDAEDDKHITDGCSNLIPGLKHAELVQQWVGLRPGRHEIRLEAESRGKLLLHNYGHGGSGLTLFWGCAGEVVDILKDNIPREMKSKL